MSPGPTAYAFNRTRRAPLAERVSVAKSHWARMRGLMGRKAAEFGAGSGLWILPSRGIHTFFMRFSIDVLYLNRDKIVVHIERELKPWRVAPVSLKTVSVLELPGRTLRSTGTEVGDAIDITMVNEQEAVPA